ncbi:hypothetical protein NDU88_005858 [Pleurodeles waltl]|uniref:Uncharacterized protein n=1 Tax=Pleurodeles waltl TaxID=8319 RepID=A0AAV7LT89_PLEWA|nr:hypothetical protein NDU88_005858 [Pleurodeles waltl]
MRVSRTAFAGPKCSKMPRQAEISTNAATTSTCAAKDQEIATGETEQCGEEGKNLTGKIPTALQQGHRRGRKNPDR